jgi:ParB family chromosome partitioning protein
MPFELVETALEAVDLQDETYRFTRPGDINALATAIDMFGLLCAPLLTPVGGRMVVVSGFSRLAACRYLGWTRVAARFSRRPADSWQYALWAVAEKAGQRPLDPLETGRALRMLRRLAPDETRFARAARALGLPDRPALEVRFTALCELPAPVREAVAGGHLTLATAASLGRMPCEAAVRMAAILAGLRFGANKQREVVELVEEIARREDRTLQAVLDTPEIAALLSDPDADRAQKGNRLRTYLYSRRFPALSAARERFEALSRELCPDPGARLNPPPGFEGRTCQLILSFESRADLARHRQTLDRILSNPAFAKILDLA